MAPRRLRSARELLTDIGALAADLREHSEAEIAEALDFLWTVNPTLFEWLARTLSARVERRDERSGTGLAGKPMSGVSPVSAPKTLHGVFPGGVDHYEG